MVFTFKSYYVQLCVGFLTLHFISNMKKTIDTWTQTKAY